MKTETESSLASSRIPAAPVRRRAPFRLPPRSELAALVRSVRADIAPEFRAFDGDDSPGILLTVGADTSGRWSYQTGDNSYTGGAYGFANWAVVSVHRDSHSFALADEIREELAEAFAQNQDADKWFKEQKTRKSLISAGLHESQTGFRPRNR